MTRAVVAALVSVLLLGACAEEEAQRGASGPDDGLQLSGNLTGKRIAVSDGEPEVVFGDCDPQDGPDTDLCVIARTLDGEILGVVFENPSALVAGDTISIGARSCVAEQCDAEVGVAIVDVRLDGEPIPVIGGSVVVLDGGPARWSGELLLRFGDGGGLSGSFSVRPSATP